MRRFSLKTERSYVGWIGRFWEWCATQERGLATTPPARISDYLSFLAPRSAAATQRQALNALVFFYEQVLERKIGKLPAWADAQRPRRLPEWLTDSEARTLLGHLRDEGYLTAALMYGAGLRIGEVVSLRLRDISFEQGVIVVRGGKGDKDRTSCLPASLVPELRLQVERARAMHREDAAAGKSGVYVPPSVARKQPAAARELLYFWLFPAAGLARDPRSGAVRRHHLHADTIAKQLRTAARRAGILRRVTCHSLRHSFATQYLLNGGTLHELKELLGHASIQTTEIYLHCLPQLGARVVSPLDYQDASKIVQLPPREVRGAERFSAS